MRSHPFFAMIDIVKMARHLSPVPLSRQPIWKRGFTMSVRNSIRVGAFLLALCLLLAGCTSREVPPESSSAPPPEPSLPPPVARYTPPELSVTAGDSCFALQPEEYVWSSVDQYGDIGQESRTAAPSSSEESEAVSLGNDGFQIIAQLPYASLQVEMAKDGETVFTDAFANLKQFTPQTGVDYLVTLTGQWEEDDYYGSCVYRFKANYALEPQFAFEPGTVSLGEVMVIYGYHIPAGATVTATTDLKQAPTFFDYEGGKVGFLAVQYNGAPGNYALQIKVNDKAYDYQIKVNDVQWEVEHLQVEESVTSSTINSAAAQEEYTRVTAPLKKISDAKQYWQGPFMVPLPQDKIKSITSEYGLVRYINNNKNPSRHDAIDYAAPAGTPVYATASGRVLYAGFLQMTGNTVVIEHGFGVKSWYFHMSALHTQTDAMVNQGDPIGAVGTTGFSTGNHLHFGVTINSMWVNPHSFLAHDLLGDPTTETSASAPESSGEEASQ